MFGAALVALGTGDDVSVDALGTAADGELEGVARGTGSSVELASGRALAVGRALADGCAFTDEGWLLTAAPVALGMALGRALAAVVSAGAEGCAELELRVAG
jgi:hypothetical protein